MKRMINERRLDRIISKNISRALNEGMMNRMRGAWNGFVNGWNNQSYQANPYPAGNNGQQQQQNNGNGQQQQQQPQQQRFGYAQQDKNGKYQFTQANAGGNSQNQSRDAYNNSFLTYCQYANAQMEKMSQCIEQGNYEQAYDWSLGAMDNLKRIQSGISKDSANGQQ